MGKGAGGESPRRKVAREKEKKMKMKRQKGKVSDVPREEVTVRGDYAIVSKEAGKMTAKQIEMAMMTMKRNRPAGAKIKAEIEAHIAVSRKPAEVRMGKGKGAIDHKVARVRENTVMFAIEKALGIGAEPESRYKEMLRVVGSKLPIKYKIVKRKESATKATSAQKG